MRRALASLAAVLACVAAPRLVAAQSSPIATQPTTIAVPPIQGTLGGDEAARLGARVRARVEAAGYRVVPTETIEMAGADALVEVLVVASDETCLVRVVARRAGASTAPEVNAPCSAGEETRARAIDDAVTRSLASLAPRAPESTAPERSTSVGRPLPEPETRHDAYVFETGIDLETKAFAGLGHLVAGTDHTDAFRGAFALTLVKNDFGDFDGALALAFGKNGIERFRGGFAAGFLTNEVDTFGGVAQIALRKNAAKDTFRGVAQVAVGWNETKRFVGVAEVAIANLDGDATALAEVGIFNGTLRTTAGGLRVGAFNYSESGHSEIAAEIAPLNMTNAFEGGVQVGLANLLGTVAPGDYFGDGGSRGDADFRGGLQLGIWNAAMGNVEAGAQVGLYNLDKSSVAGMLQLGVVNGVTENAELAFQIGVANSVKHRFSGFLEVGATSYATTMHGAQVGGVNMAQEVRGVQIGIANVARKELHGIQIGVFNIAENGILPILPVFNAGL